VLILAVTHPDAISRDPRSLSQGGRQQALFAARRMRENQLDNPGIYLCAVVSAPSARCLETAIIVAREFGETTYWNGECDGVIEVRNELASGPVDQEQINAVLNSLQIPKQEDKPRERGVKRAVLLSVHADLARMLEKSTEFDSQWVSDGWFARGAPIIAAFDFEDRQLGAVKFCEAFQQASWISCIS